MTFKRILCPTDFSEASGPALKYASALARRYGAHLTVLHVVPSFDPVVVPTPGIMYPVQGVSAISREDVLHDVGRVVTDARVECDQVLPSRPKPAILPGSSSSEPSRRPPIWS